jgi:hypothetical protein
MTEGLGSDWNQTHNDEGAWDLDPTGATVEGALAVAQCVVRGWETPQGSMEWAPSEGFALADWLNADIDEADRLAIASGAEADALTDERVWAISVGVTFSASSQTLTVSGQGVTAEGPFKLVIASSGLDASILQVSE